jgi:hypothetical protein
LNPQTVRLTAVASFVNPVTRVKRSGRDSEKESTPVTLDVGYKTAMTSYWICASASHTSLRQAVESWGQAHPFAPDAVPPRVGHDDAFVLLHRSCQSKIDSFDKCDFHRLQLRQHIALPLEGLR